MRRMFVSSTVLAVLSLSVLVTVGPAADASAMQAATRDIKVISSAGARAMADACIAWAEQYKSGSVAPGHSVHHPPSHQRAAAACHPTLMPRSVWAIRYPEILLQSF